MARKKYFHKIPGFKEYLKNAYIDKQMTMAQIAKELGTTAATILHNLRRFKIQIRETAEYHKGKKLTPEHIEIIRKRHTGKTVSAETRKKLSESRKALKLKSPNWKGGKRTGRTDGYIQVYRPDHYCATKEGYVMEHRLVMEEKIGRLLTTEEEVHHVNGKRDDNRPENLELMASKKEHMSYHMYERWRIKREQNMSCG